MTTPSPPTVSGEVFLLQDPKRGPPGEKMKGCKKFQRRSVLLDTTIDHGMSLYIYIYTYAFVYIHLVYRHRYIFMYMHIDIDCYVL